MNYDVIHEPLLKAIGPLKSLFVEIFGNDRAELFEFMSLDSNGTDGFITYIL